MCKNQRSALHSWLEIRLKRFTAESSLGSQPQTNFRD